MKHFFKYYELEEKISLCKSDDILKSINIVYRKTGHRYKLLQKIRG